MTESDEFWDDLFHGCALAAFVDQAIRQGSLPDQEATRQLAFRYYEDALAEKNARRNGNETSEGTDDSRSRLPSRG
jgi:hypothetical protein